MTRRPAQPDRRTLWMTAGVLAGAIVIGVLVVTVATPTDGPRRDRDVALSEPGASPHIIPRPNEGRAPRQPGDRGGWEQLAALGAVLVGLVAVGGLAWRSSRRARSGRSRSAQVDATKSATTPASSGPRSS